MYLFDDQTYYYYYYYYSHSFRGYVYCLHVTFKYIIFTLNILLYLLLLPFAEFRGQHCF